MKIVMFITIAMTYVCQSTFAAKVETLEIESPSMHKQVKVDVVLPDSYSTTGNTFSVVYLLHGYSGNYESWVKDFPETAKLADLYNIIVVSPDGGYSSWYFDSPIDPASQYETFVSKEVVDKIDSTYATIKSRTGRAISGLSMGGHGALYIAFRHQDVFGAAGSMSGGVDIRPFPENWDISKRLGDYAAHKQNWEDNTVVNLVYLLKPNSLALTIDCGTSDFFYPANKKLHEELLYRNIPHDYTERPGGHTLDYWQNSELYQMLFFSQYFNKMNSMSHPKSP
jgi:S-formylglutathione hydrolase FrmB